MKIKSLNNASSTFLFELQADTTNRSASRIVVRYVYFFIVPPANIFTKANAETCVFCQCKKLGGVKTDFFSRF